MTKKKILVIDDESGLLEMVKIRLEMNDYDVVTAMDGAEGIVKAGEEMPDLIILDVLMPHLDGRGFLTELKKIEKIKETPVIIFTARPDMQDLFAEEGVRHYIIKPYQADEFLKKIKCIWGQHHPQETSEDR